MMRTAIRSRPGGDVRRRGAASAELAVVLSTLVFICLATCDFARSTYDAMAVANCARNGALYLCDPASAAATPYKSLQEAVRADAGYLSPAPTGSSTTGTDASGNDYVEVTVSYPFECTVNYPGLLGSFTIRRTVRMLVAPS
jgi:hypothetical protein